MGGLPALPELAVPELLESRKLAGGAKVWYRAKNSARTAVAVSNNEVALCFFCLAIPFFYCSDPDYLCQRLAAQKRGIK